MTARAGRTAPAIRKASRSLIVALRRIKRIRVGKYQSRAREKMDALLRWVAAMLTDVSNNALRRTVLIVALLNLAYFGVEFVVALSIASVSLFADSVDFLEDTSVNLLILLALGWSLKARSQVGMHWRQSCSSRAWHYCGRCGVSSAIPCLPNLLLCR
jgi:hypothetical protein